MTTVDERKVSPGVYLRKNGEEIHFDIPELLEATGWDDTPANRTEMEKIAMDAAIEAGLMKPETRIEQRHRHRCTRCKDEWQHDGRVEKCILPAHVICAVCKS